MGCWPQDEVSQLRLVASRSVVEILTVTDGFDGSRRRNQPEVALAFVSVPDFKKGDMTGLISMGSRSGVTLIAAWIASFAAVGEELVSKGGRKIDAKILSVTEDEVSFQRRGTEKVHQVPLTGLSEDTVKLLRSWKPSPSAEAATSKVTRESLPRFEITFEAKKNNRAAEPRKERNRRESISPKVTIKNTDRSKNLDGVQMTAVTFSRGIVEKRTIKVLKADTFDVSVIAGTKRTYQCSGTSYVFDKASKEKHGFKYQGYAVVLHDKEGNVLYSKSSPEGYAKIPEKVLKVKAGGSYDSNLEPKS